MLGGTFAVALAESLEVGSDGEIKVICTSLPKFRLKSWPMRPLLSYIERCDVVLALVSPDLAEMPWIYCGNGSGAGPPQAICSVRRSWYEPLANSPASR
jgi:hypothetical protein